MDPTQSWEQIVSQKRTARDLLLAPYLVNDLDSRGPRVENVDQRSRLENEPQVQEITDIDNIATLHQLLQKGEVTAEQVVLAYIKRAVVAHQLTNCLTEVCFAEALTQAKALDTEFKKTGQIKGPLHGIPITLKDQFNVKGLDTTIGYVGRSFSPATEDAVLVQMLKNMGAIIIAKTNLCQSIMWAETENPLWGLTTNARDPSLTPGGSTGGEGPLLALHGSILGFGTDIGGSVRIPQSIAGLYGFKPSSSRLPYYGVPVSTSGQDHIPSSIGPMTRNLSSTIHTMQLLTQSSPWTLDPRCTPLPWNSTTFESIQKRPLVIGLIQDDGVVKVHPPISRLLSQLVSALKSAGHEIIPWDTSDHASAIEIMDKYYTVDGGEDIRRDMNVAGEPYIPHVQALVDRGKPISVFEYWQINKRRNEAHKRYLDKWNSITGADGKKVEVDVLLAPALPHTSVPHRSFRWVGYTKIWNFLDYPALTMPFGNVEKGIDNAGYINGGGEGDGYVPRNELDEWNWKLWDAERMDGFPVNLQIVGRKLDEERVLGAARVIEEVWKSRGTA